jgi:O-antigen ligase
MTSRVRRINHQQAETASISNRIDSAILWITLGTLFVVPLIFGFADFVAVFSELKLVTLHLGAGLIAILWLWQIAINKINAPETGKPSGFDVLRWAAKSPARWLIISVALWLVSQAISTLLSPLPIISLLGADDSRSGYNLYDNISLFVIFATVAVRFRTERCIRLLVITLISSGTIAAAYGIAQHFGWDPIGDSEGRSRVWSSFGNPLNFGSYMVMAIPATLAMALPKRERKYLWLGILAVAVGLQLSGLWFTGGRGPYFAFVAGLISFGLISMWIGQFKALASSGITLLGGLVIAIIIIVIPSPQDDTGLSRILDIGDQIVGLSDEELDNKGGLDARFDIWGTTLETATGWDTPRDESALSSVLRPVFGFGPDMFIYSYPLVAEPQSGNNLVDHPHNYELQILMEQGVAGLILLLAVLALIVITIYRVITILKSEAEELNFLSILLLATAPALIGKLIEMQSGVSRVTELTMTFALFGVVSALWFLASTKYPSADPSPTETEPSKLSLSLKPSTVSGITILATLVVSSVVLITLVGWDLRRTSASLSWSSAVNASTDIERATEWFESQADAPERPLFTNSLFIELFNAAVDQHNLENEDGAFKLMHTARQLLLDYEERDPYKRDVQINLFKTEVLLSSWGQTEYSEQAVERSEMIFKLYPAYLSMLQLVADDMPFVGRDDLAADYNAKIKAAK